MQVPMIALVVRISIVSNKRVVGLLSEKGHSEYLHSIANLALLSSGANAALSNSTFDVKRTEIIKMDKKGAFIPFCTRMVFLKYYTSSDKNQLHFWERKIGKNMLQK